MHGSNSNLRIKIQDFPGLEISKKSASFWASTYEFDSKTRQCETKNAIIAMPMQHFFVH